MTLDRPRHCVGDEGQLYSDPLSPITHNVWHRGWNVARTIFTSGAESASGHLWLPWGFTSEQLDREEPAILDARRSLRLHLAAVFDREQEEKAAEYKKEEPLRRAKAEASWYFLMDPDRPLPEFKTSHEDMQMHIDELLGLKLVRLDPFNM